MDCPNFLKRQGDAYIFNETDKEFIFYVPEGYFESKNAEVVGEIVTVLGILEYTIKDKTGKNTGLKSFRYPTQFQTKPGRIEKVKNVKLTKYCEPEDYRLLVFSKGDEVIHNVKTAQDIENVENFYRRFLISGNIPNTISYNDIHNIILDCGMINGVTLPVTTQLLGVIISEICRDKNDDTKPFRLSKNDDMYDYNSISIKQIPKSVSPFSAITSENWDEAVVSAILNDKEVKNPMEKILMK